MSNWVFISRGISHINSVDLVEFLAQSHQEIGGLDVAVNEILVVHEFYAGDDLICDHQGRLESKLAPADVQIFFQTIAQQLRH